MEEGETPSPFWLQPHANCRQSRFNSGVLLFTLCLILSLFSLLIILPLFSLSPQIPRPNLMKNSWESLYIVFILVALIFGFFSRIRNQELISTVGSTAGKAQKLDESTTTVWYEISGPATVIDDQAGAKIRNDVPKADEPAVKGWYEYSDRTAVIDGQTDNKFSLSSRTRNQESISTIRSTDSKIGNKMLTSNESTTRIWYENFDSMAGIDGQSGTEMGYEVNKSDKSMPRVMYGDSNRTSVVNDWNGGGYKYSDLMAVIDDQNGSEIRNVQKLDESTVRGWYEYSDQMAVIDDQNGNKTRNGIQKSDKSTAREQSEYSNPMALVGSRDRWCSHDDTPLAPEANLADGASHIRKSQSPHLERVNSEVNIVNTGIVLSVSNDIAHIQVLDEVSVGEVVEFDEGVIGIVLNRESPDSVRVQLMGDNLMIQKGSCVKATGKIANEGVAVNSGEISASESRVIENRETNKIDENRAVPAVRRRKCRRARTIAERALENTKINTGTVLGVAFGIARIQCVEDVVAGEIIEFSEGTIGIALNSDYVLLMGNGLMIQEGSCVNAKGKIAQMPVSEAWLSGFLSALARPVEDIGEFFASESELNAYGQPNTESLCFVGSEENNIKQSDENLSPLSRANKGKTSEEMSDFEPTNEDYESSSSPIMAPKEEEKEDSDDDLEPKDYESSASPIISRTRSIKIEKKRGGNVTRDFLTSLGIKKKNQRQKSVESIDSLFESQPPSPPPPSAAIQSFFSLKKGKGKRDISVPPPPLLYSTTAHEQKHVAVEAPDITRKPPLPVKVQSFMEVAPSTSGVNSLVTGAESPLHPIPPPPPLPPFQMPGWKFVLKGDYVKIASANTSRSVSPERDSNFGGDVAVGSSMFCPSPDVNSKADMFIANFRAGLKLQKMNSLKQKQGVGLSNLGPVEPNQAKA